jgi:hypothetical protein
MNSNSLASHVNIHSYQLVLEYILPDMYNPKYWKKINSKYSYMHIQLVTGFTLDFSIYLANTGITHWKVVKSTFSIPKLCFWILDFLLLGELVFINPFCKQNDQGKSFITFETFPKKFLLIGHICDILQKLWKIPVLYRHASFKKKE